MSSRESSPSPPAPEPRKEKRFNNGWSHEQEELMAKWADIASCYRWMHDRAEKSFYKKNLSITIPVIVLSTLTGTANFGISSIFGSDQNGQKMASFAIGGVSIIAGVLTTLGNFLRYAQLNEAHRVCGIAWGKFQRQIAVELSLHPNDRQDSMDFIKICRTELDRLIEQSPVIPDSIIAEFQEIFGDNEALEKPEIVGDIDHTTVFRDNRTRLMDIATNAALMMRHKKNLLKEIVTDDLNKQIADEVQRRLSDTKRELREKVSALAPAPPATPSDLRLRITTPTGPIGPATEDGFTAAAGVSTSQHTLKPANTIETSDRVYGKI
jgi:hypothetical protein